jgi:hypothetical protein
MVAVQSTVIPIIMIIAYLVGLIVSIVLLVKVKGTPAILSTVAFALLFLQNLGGAIFRSATVTRLIYSNTSGRTGPWIGTGTSCCCGILQLAAIICLIVAIWQAVSGKAEESLE